jgi:hypothetical protein
MAPRKGSVPHNKGKGKAAQSLAAAAPPPPTAAAAAAAEAIQPQIAVPEAAPVVSMTALQQLEDKRKRLCNQLKDVERQVGQAAGCRCLVVAKSLDARIACPGTQATCVPHIQCLCCTVVRCFELLHLHLKHGLKYQPA